jgi:hypothetical protein
LKNFLHKDDFYDKQNSSTKKYFDNYPVWNDVDIVKYLAIGVAIGFGLGFIL